MSIGYGQDGMRRVRIEYLRDSPPVASLTPVLASSSLNPSLASQGGPSQRQLPLTLSY